VPRPTPEDDKLHIKKNERSGNGEVSGEGDAARNDNNNSTTTAQVSSTSTEPHMVTVTLDREETFAPHQDSRPILLKGNLDMKQFSRSYSHPPQHLAENGRVRHVDVSDTPIRISRPFTNKGPLMRSHHSNSDPSPVGDGRPNDLNQTERSSHKPPQTTRGSQDPAKKRKAQASLKANRVEHHITSKSGARQAALDEEDHNMQDSGQENSTNKQSAKMGSLLQDVDLKHQLQQLIQHIRKLQEILDPSSISHDAPQTSSRTSSRQPREVDSTTLPPRDESKIRARNSLNPNSQTLTSRDESIILPRTAKARNNVHALPLASSVDIQEHSSKKRVDTVVQSSQLKRRILKPTLRYVEIERFYLNVRNSYGGHLGDTIIFLEKMESRRITPLLAKFKEVFIAQSGVPALERVLRQVKQLRRESTPHHAEVERLGDVFWTAHARVLNQIIIDLEKMTSRQIVPLVAVTKQAHSSALEVLRFWGTTASSPSVSSRSYDQLFYRYQRIMSIHYHILHELARALEDTASSRLAPLTEKVNEIILRHQSIAMEKKSQKIKAMKQERAVKARQRQAQHPPSVVTSSILSESRVRQVKHDASASDELTNYVYETNVPMDREAHQPTKQHGLAKAEIGNQKTMIHNAGLRSQNVENKNILKTNHLEQGMASQLKPGTGHEQVAERRYETQRLSRNIHTQSRTMSSSKHLDTPKPSTQASSPRKDDEVASPSMRLSEADAKAKNERSLLEELFPEASSYIQPHFPERNPYPKLDLPSGKGPLVVRQHLQVKKSLRERVIESFQKSGERITALQFLNCSTEFTESDFRRLIPKGKHIESWATKGEFYKVIPGRDPLSLERLPFYYLLFKSTESALAYQANVARLHKLCSLRQASNIMSVMPVPKGLLEDGEDISAAMSSYLLKPSSLRLNLNMVMQPYNPALRTLLENGGYRPIEPSLALNGKPLYKVLLQINGWEPTEEDLYKILSRHARQRGITWPFHTESSLAIRKLRDVIDLKTRMLPISSSSPRAKNSASEPKTTELDPTMGFMLPEPGQMEGNINQMVMGRVYNRWIVEFDEEDGARRFSRLWHRRVLPQPKFVTWRDTEEERMVSAEFLW
jgi:hypothetical protein